MGNKTLSIGTKTETITDDSNEIIYSDISMTSKDSFKSYFTSQEESDYLARLTQEGKKDESSVRLTDHNGTPLTIQYNYDYTGDESLRKRLTKVNKTVKVDKSINVRAVQNSIDNIFSWNTGERILNPEFGTKLRQYLYEGITQMTQELIVAEIKNQFQRWDPRVIVTKVSAIDSDENTDNNTIELDIEYNIKDLPDEIFHKQYLYMKNS